MPDDSVFNNIRDFTDISTATTMGERRDLS
jgi:hypothetical protein